MSGVWVVIPAYNEARTIRAVAERALAVNPNVIVVDDGSSDGTGAALAGLPLTLLRNEPNQGKAASLWRGMQHALAQGAQTVITLDGDGQHAPEEIPRLLELAVRRPGHIVIGARLADKAAIPPRRYYANKVANFWISWAAGYPIADSQSGFRLYPAALLRGLNLRHERERGFVFESEILIEAARRGVYSLPLPIAAVYQPGARASHFRSVLDIVRITRMVAWKLASRGMYPQGLVRAFVLPRARRLRAEMGADGLAMLVLSNLVMAASAGLSLVWQVYRVYRAARETPATTAAGCYLVLGMRLRHGQVAADYAARLQRALVLYRRDPHARIVVLGGETGNGAVSEAVAGRAFLLERGVPAAAILVEDASRHTLENLRHARDILRELCIAPVALITSRYHLARAYALARGLGIQHALCAAEERLVLDRRTLLRLLREAYYLHWYVVGRAWSVATANKKMLGRIA